MSLSGTNLKTLIITVWQEMSYLGVPNLDADDGMRPLGSGEYGSMGEQASQGNVASSCSLQQKVTICSAMQKCSQSAH